MKYFVYLLFSFAISFSLPSHAGPSVLKSVTDSLGNAQTNSFGEEGSDFWPVSVVTPVIVNVGQSIDFTVLANDPEGDSLEYRFAVQRPGGSAETRQDWSDQNTWQWEVGAQDFGVDLRVVVSVRDDDKLNPFGELLGDDYTSLTYNVQDSNGLVQPQLISVRDSLGNLTSNSIGSNGQLGWPNSVPKPVRVNVGDLITLTAQADAFDDSPLQYRFAVQPPGGSLEVIQDWSASSSAVWRVSANKYGSGAFAFVAVRNNDGRNLFGDFSGDDYTDLEYFVNDPSASSPARIIEVKDSRGNTQRNSFGQEQSGDWSNGRPSALVKEGETIAFTVSASDNDSTRLEYQFSIQRVSGSFQIRRDWSTENTWNWKVDREDFGNELVVAVAVRDDDGRPFFGSFGGDDYTYLTYKVTVDISGAVQLILQ